MCFLSASFVPKLLVDVRLFVWRHLLLLVFFFLLILITKSSIHSDNVLESSDDDFDIQESDSDT